MVVKHTRLLVAAAALVVATTSAASASMRDFMKYCDPINVARETLKDKFNKAPVAIGETKGGNLIELFSTENGEGWTLLMHFGETGEACSLASGTNWTETEWKAPNGKGY